MPFIPLVLTVVNSLRSGGTSPTVWAGGRQQHCPREQWCDDLELLEDSAIKYGIWSHLLRRRSSKSRL